MKTLTAVHPAEETLAAYGLGRADETTTAEVLAHLEFCEACRGRVSGLPSDSFVSRLLAAQASAVVTPATNIDGSRQAVPPELANWDQYEVLRELGRGGMGVVYLARNRLLGREEVLKVLNPTMLDRPDAADRFHREVQAAARLRHPNVIAAHAAVQRGELLVFAMEFVQGQDLARLVRANGRLEVADACEYAIQATEGLQHAHEMGMVHRDIKPANLMLTSNGGLPRVKILDFGLSKVGSEAGFDPSLTDKGRLLGTPDFMAPEQARDPARADIRADIYGLGCTLYFMLAGRPPFAAPSLLSLLEHHKHTLAAPLDRVRPDVPAGLASVVAKMMAKDPAARFQTPADAAKALAPFARKGTLAGAATVRKAWRYVAVAASLLLLAAGGWAASTILKVKTSDGVLVVEVNEPNAEVYVDGERVSVTWDRGGKTAEVKVRPGTRKVEVKKDGFTAFGDEVSLEDGKRKVLAARLEKTAPTVKSDTAAPAKSQEPPPIPKAKAAKTTEAEQIAALEKVLLDHEWFYLDNLYPPGDTCRFHADGRFHVWRWKYQVVGPRRMLVDFNAKDTGVPFTFNEELSKFTAEWTDPGGREHKVTGTRR